MPNSRARRMLTVLAFTALLLTREATAAQLTATWTDNSGGIATTRIERRPAADPSFTPVADVSPGVTAFVDAALDPGATYCYRALAYDADGASPYTDEVCATTSTGAYSVTVTKAGTGSGTVTSAPAGIDCGATCAATFADGTPVVLTAVAASDATFDGWSGSGCSGSDPCTLAGNAAVAVTASFTRAGAVLTVTASGPGTVTSAPAGIVCGSDCSESYPAGTSVTLTAVPRRNAKFIGWNGGGCAGTDPTCVVNVQTATSISASFARKNA
jgi:hypothetical protein